MDKIVIENLSLNYSDGAESLKDISLQIPANQITVRLTKKALADRKKLWKPPQPRFTQGCLAKYAALATSADTGGILKW